MINGGPIRPASATAAPGAPPKRDPKTTEKFTTLGPGRNCDCAKASLNSSAALLDDHPPRPWQRATEAGN